MKSFLKSFFFYTAVPSLMLILSIGTYYYTHSVISALMPVLGVGVGFVVTREQDDSNPDSVRTTLVAATFFLIGYWFLYQLHLPISPWGITGWIIFTCVILTIFITGAIQCSFDLDADFWNQFLELFVLIGCLSQIYLFWGTYFVWIPLGTFVVYEYVLMGLDRQWKENANHLELFVTSSGIGAVSMLTQFWYSHVLGCMLWQVVGAVSIIAGLVFLSVFLEKNGNKKALKKKQEEQRILAEKQDLEQKRIKREQLAESEKKRNQELDDLTKKLLDEETVSVDDVFELSKSGRRVPHEVIAKIDFTQLFKISEVKNQITWKSSQLDEIFKQLQGFFITCYDDELLKKTIQHCLQLKELSKYAGYEALRRSMLHLKEISPYVELPEAPEKKPEQITN